MAPVICPKMTPKSKMVAPDPNLLETNKTKLRISIEPIIPASDKLSPWFNTGKICAPMIVIETAKEAPELMPSMYGPAK